MNLKIRLFKQSIVNFTDKSDLPAEVKRLILGEIYNEIERQANAAINTELMEEEERVKENGRSDEDVQ